MSGTSALVGYTGFVGTTLCRQRSFDDLFRSVNIGDIAGREFDLLICAGAPAAKWKANQEPEQDLANLTTLMNALRSVKARRAVLVSTVDVYSKPLGVDENSPVPENPQAYGRNRYLLENFFAEHFGDGALTVRLPGLVGEGLKKNFLFDLKQNRQALHLTDHRSKFQFYDMSGLWRDLQVAMDSGLHLVNFATEPVQSGDVARECFGDTFTNETANGPVFYDMQTIHAGAFGSQGRYIASKEQVYEGIRRFAALVDHA